MTRPAAARDFRRMRVEDARSGKRMLLLHPADEPRWAEWLGARAMETWSRFTHVHAGKGTEVRRGTLHDGGPAHYFKIFRPRGPADRWKDLFRAPRAVRAWRNSWTVSALGFRVIPPVCLMTGRRWARDLRDLLVTREMEGVPLRTWFAQSKIASARKAVLDALGREVARWHGAGLAHADLNLDNLLLTWERDTPVFIWLDLEGLRRYRWGVGISRRAKELADLNNEPRAVTLRERVRFWRSYRRAAGLPSPAASRLRAAAIERTLYRWRKRGWLLS